MRRVLVWCVVLVCGGCSSFIAPVQRSMMLATSPSVAYTHAAQTLARMGAQVQVADAQSRMLSGVVHGVVVLNIRVDEESTVFVTGSLLPGKIVAGSFTEVDSYLALLTQDSRHGQ